MLNLNELANLPYFSLLSLRSQDPKEPLPVIKYQLKRGNIVSLKRGVYVAKEYINKITYQGKVEVYREYLGSQLVQPSYISLDYALSSYSMITEAPYSLTLITLKTPRVFKNEIGLFRYYNIKNSLFTGFKMVKKGEFTIPFASRAKALFDFLYFKKRILREINTSIIGELRLNFEEMSKLDWEEFNQYITLSNSKKMKKIVKFLK